MNAADARVEIDRQAFAVEDALTRADDALKIEPADKIDWDYVQKQLWRAVTAIATAHSLAAYQRDFARGDDMCPRE
jgi:hypothetical protein